MLTWHATRHMVGGLTNVARASVVGTIVVEAGVVIANVAKLISITGSIATVEALNTDDGSAVCRGAGLERVQADGGDGSRDQGKGCGAVASSPEIAITTASWKCVAANEISELTNAGEHNAVARNPMCTCTSCQHCRDSEGRGCSCACYRNEYFVILKIYCWKWWSVPMGIVIPERRGLNTHRAVGRAAKSLPQ